MEVIPYDAVANAVVVFFAFCGAIVLIVNAVKAVKDLRKPSNDHIKMVLDHDEKLLNDYEDISELKKEVRIILECLRPMLKHQIDGNSVDVLQEKLDFLDRYLINLVEK